jgi:hypothetical protein
MPRAIVFFRYRRERHFNQSNLHCRNACANGCATFMCRGVGDKSPTTNLPIVAVRSEV